MVSRKTVEKLMKEEIRHKIENALYPIKNALDTINKRHKQEDCKHENVEFQTEYKDEWEKAGNCSILKQRTFAGAFKWCVDCDLTLETYKTEAEYHRAKIKHYEDQIKKERELLDEEKVK